MNDETSQKKEVKHRKRYWVYMTLGVVFLSINIATFGYYELLRRSHFTLLAGVLLVAISPICFLVSFFLGHGWKRKLPGCLLSLLSLLTAWPVCIVLFAMYWMYCQATLTDRFPFKEVSPDKQTTAILEYDAEKCFVIVLDKQAFHTKGSIYLNAKGDWDGNDLFRFYSSDIGVNYEFRRTENGWVGTPEDMIRFVEERE